MVRGTPDVPQNVGYDDYTGVLGVSNIYTEECDE
jgi:hypothetical protein